MTQWQPQDGFAGTSPDGAAVAPRPGSSTPQGGGAWQAQPVDVAAAAPYTGYAPPAPAGRFTGYAAAPTGQFTGYAAAPTGQFTGYAPPAGYGAPSAAGAGFAPQWPAQVPPGFGISGGAVVPLASYGKRVGALLLDSLLAGAPVLLGYVFLFAVMTATANPVTGEPDGSGALVGMLVWLVSWAVSVGLNWWNRWVRQGRTGQSWGKSIVGTRLVGLSSGLPIGAGMAFVRDLAHNLDSGSMYIGYLWPLWDAQRQTFADKLCTTVVVDA